MSAHEIELILSRQLAEGLSTAIFIVDPEGNLLFYNEPAEGLLGRTFEETGEMPVAVWSTIFKPLDDTGEPYPPEKLPLVQTLANHKPAHGSFWIESLKGDKNKVNVTSLPITARPDRFIGAMAIFWTPS